MASAEGICCLKTFVLAPCSRWNLSPKKHRRKACLNFCQFRIGRKISFQVFVLAQMIFFVFRKFVILRSQRLVWPVCDFPDIQLCTKPRSRLIVFSFQSFLGFLAHLNMGRSRGWKTSILNLSLLNSDPTFLLSYLLLLRLSILLLLRR